MHLLSYLSRRGLRLVTSPLGCVVGDALADNCSIGIRVNQLGGGLSHFADYNRWALGDSRLDWYYRQAGQAQDAWGTPMVWTTDDVTDYRHRPQNQYVDSHNRVDVESGAME